MFSELDPTKGSLLLSEPFMMDQNFERSVILLCDHDNEVGTTGLILNQPSAISFCDIWENVDNADFPIYIGGPVEQNALFFIHKAFDRLQSGNLIRDGLYWGGEFDRLVDLVNDHLLSPEEVKIFLGYSGWSPRQLVGEISQNSWAVHNDCDTDLVFYQDGEDLWKQALISLGPKYAHVANFPKRPEFN